MANDSNLVRIAKKRDSSAVTWNRNHEQIRRAIEKIYDDGKREFTLNELHAYTSSLNSQWTISATRLRTHLDGYASRKRYDEARSGGCKTFLEERYLEKIKDGRLMKFRVMEPWVEERKTEFRTVLDRYRTFEQWDYDPGTASTHKAYRHTPLLRTFRVNFPRGAFEQAGPLAPEKTVRGRYRYGSVEKGFLNYVLRKVFLAYATTLALDSLRNRSYPPTTLGVLDWLLTRRNKPLPKAALAAFAEWLNMGPQWWQQKALFILEVDMQRIIQLLKESEGVRYLSPAFNDPLFKKRIRSLLFRHRDYLIARRQQTLPRLRLPTGG